MNYVGKFESSGLESPSNAHIELDSLSHRGGPANSFTVPDAHLLFSGDYHRSGPDLIISDHDHRVVVPNYFHGDKRPALVSPEGAPLDPKVVDALTGHAEYAQAGAAPAAKLIGHVAKLTGSASVVRNGVTVEVQNGDAVYQSDVVQTGSSSTLGLVLIDGTTFNLSANARLMLNDLTYDATSSSNSSLITLVQGAASFVAGQVAKTGDMKVASPVATMGIRGTAVILDISATDGKVSISVIDQRDGQTHTVQVFNTQGILIGTVTSNGNSLTLTPTATFDVIAQESGKTPAQIAFEFATFQAVLNTYDIQKAIDPSLPQHTDNGSGNNPQPTKYAALGSTPLNSPQTEYHSPAGTNPTITSTTGGDKITFTVTPSFGEGNGAIGSNQATVDTPTPAQQQQQQQQQENPTTTAATPFVVNPPTVTQISSGTADHFGPVMSADGQFVTYDPDGAIFLFDRKTGTTITISPADGGTYIAPSVSSDGRFVVYQDSDGHVFLYNNDASSAQYKTTTPIGAGTSPVISGDGSRIVVAHDGNIVVYDQQGHVLSTITPADAGAAVSLVKPAISADGHVIAFWGADSANADGPGHLYVYDRSTGIVSAIASTTQHAGASAASISADGHYVVYQSADAGGHTEIYLYDLHTSQVLFHTANASGGSYNPVISPDGHFIIFASDAKLTSSDSNEVADTYVVDVTDPSRPIFKLVSALADGTAGNAASNLGATISAGGLFIAFGSHASNFSTGDGPGGDIFVVDPSSGRSAIINETASSPATLTASGTIAVTGDHTGTTVSVSGDHPERLSASFDSNGDIVWTFSEAKSDFASLPYGQDLTQQFAITLNFSGGTTTTAVTVTVHNSIQPVITVTNTPPVIHDATIVVSEGGAVVLTPADMHVTDPDDSSFTFKVTNVTHGVFQVLVGESWFNTATFTSSELAAGHVRFMHDGGEAAPTFSIQASDGEALSNVQVGTVNFTHVNDAPVVNTAAIVVAPGDTVVLDASVLKITHTDSVSDFSGFQWRADLPGFSGSAAVVTDVTSSFLLESSIGVNDPDSSSFTFTVSNVTHGVFQTTTDGETWIDATTFTTADINTGHVRFVREDSDATPTFSIQADDGTSANHLSGVFAGSVVSPPIVIVPNHAPVITVASLTVSEGGTVLVAPDDISVSDPDSSSFTFTVSNVTHGKFQTTADGDTWMDATTFTTVDLNAGDVRFVHDGGEAAPTFSIQADDGHAANHLSNVEAGTVAFTNVNDPPSAVPVTLAPGTEDATYIIHASDLLAGATDPDSPLRSITAVSVASGGGSVVDNHDGTFTYTPAPGYAGPVSFNYTVSDGALTASSTASLTLDYETAVAPTLVVGSGTKFVPTDGAALSTQLSLHAGDVISLQWNFTTDDYLPFEDFAFVTVNGAAFLLSDIQSTGSYGSTGWHTFNYTVTADGIYTIGAGVMSDKDTAVMSYLALDNLRVNGTLVQSFENGLAGITALGSVQVVATAHGGVNPTPILPTDGSWEAFLSSNPVSEFQMETFLDLAPGSLVHVGQAEGPEHSPIVVPIGVSIAGNTHPDETYVTISGAPAGSVLNHGVYDSQTHTWRVDAADLGGNLTITTPIGYSGTFSLTVTATSVVHGSHTSATSAPQTQIVTVDAVAPVAVAVTLSDGTEDALYTIQASDLLAGVTDIAGTPLSITALSVVSGGGTLVHNGNGTWTYTPAANYNGPVSFNYTASDGSLTSNSTASLNLAAVNDPPVATPVTLAAGTEDTAYTITSTALLTGVTDIDSTTLSVTSVSIASGGGSLVNHGDGTWTYTPAANYNGPVSFNYTASDGSLTSSPTARLNLVAVNDAPTISAGTVASGAISVPVTPQNHVSAAVASALATSGLISGLPGESGFGALALGAGDDNSSGAINITSVFGASGVNFFGHNYTSLYVNNNGNITFNAPTSAFTPSVINAGTNNPIIAAFWADVDTRRAGAVYYDLDAADGIMTITWDHVGYYSVHHNKFDTFQIVLISEGNGNFDIEYRYNNIQWTTGDASGGANGLNGTSARAGYSAGDGMHYFELPQSGNQSALLSLPTTNGNTGIAGVDHFEVRNGEVGPSTLTSTGTINFSDPDLNDIHAIQSVTYTGSGDHLGTLTLVKNADTTGTGIGGKFTWTYTADPTAIRTALDGLSTHSKVETFDVMISDGAGGTVTQSVAVTLTETGNHAPVINVDNLHVTQHGGGTTTVSGLSVTDSDATSNEIFTVAATTAGAASGTTVTPATGSGHLADINATLATGVTYHEGNTPPSTDRVAVSVADGHGATDTVSMIFSNAAEHGAALTFTGTTGKDVFFATGHQDQFVFAAHFNHDTIMNFAPGQDHLDLSAVVTTNNPGDWISAHVAASPANPADTLITVDAADTIVLHGVSTAGLSANDFILHPGTA